MAQIKKSPARGRGKSNVIELARMGSSVIRTEEESPWLLDVDAIVIQRAETGYLEAPLTDDPREIVEAWQRLREMAEARTGPSFGPSSPFLIPLEGVLGGRVNAKYLIVATTESTRPEIVETVAAVLRLARSHGVKRLALPLFRTGEGGWEPVIARTLAALDIALPEAPLSEIVIFGGLAPARAALRELRVGSVAAAEPKTETETVGTPRPGDGAQTVRQIAERYLRNRDARLAAEVRAIFDWMGHLAPLRATGRHQLSSRLLILGTLDYLRRVDPSGSILAKVSTPKTPRDTAETVLANYFKGEPEWPPRTPAPATVSWLTANAAEMLDAMSEGRGRVTVLRFVEGLMKAPADSTGAKTLKRLNLDPAALGTALLSVDEMARNDGGAGVDPDSAGGPQPPDPADAADDEAVPDSRPDQPPVRQDYVGRLWIDSPFTSGVDAIGIGNEVSAFARLVASRTVSPPLSVGVFGDWGAGKSYFMDQVRRAVDDLGTQTADRFHNKIVHIHFNAWHYIETNLWASLVEYIFTELDRWLRTKVQASEKDIEAMFAQLSTTKEMKLAAAEDLIRARLDHKTADAELARAQSALAEARRSRFEDLVKAALTDEQRIALTEASAALGLPTAGRSAAQLVQTWTSAGQEVARGRLVGKSLLATLGQGRSVLLAVAALLAAPLAVAGLLWLLEGTRLDGFVTRIHEGVIALSALAASFTGILGSWIVKGRKAVDTMERIQAAVAENAERRAQAAQPALTAAESEVEKARQEVLEAERRLALASAAAAESARSYDADTARGRLNRFIRQRASDGDYARHLGMVATIRKDFGQLSQMMAEDADSWSEDVAALNQAYGEKAKALISEYETLLSEREIADLLSSEASQERYFERIILYVDDLDRCPPDKVADVLQAIHMLLYFPLFVVFVAVDAKWLAFSLHEHFPAMRIASQPADGSGSALAAGPAAVEDYLEKIFQVPYWVPGMDAEDAFNFVGSLTDDAVASLPEEEGDSVKAAVPGNGDGEAIATEDQESAGDAATDPGSEGVEPGPEPAEDEAAGRGKGEEQAPAAGPVYVDLTLTPGEQQDLRALAAHVGKTPRRIKAYVNRYFLVQTTLRLHDPERAQLRITTRAVATLLAIATASPRGAAEFFDKLDSIPEGTPLGSLAAARGPADEELVGSDVLQGLIALQRSEPAGSDEEMVAALRRNAGIVRRYSFRTGTSARAHRPVEEQAKA